MRFPGFTEPWQRTTFKEICKITTGSKNTQDKVNNGLYPFYVRSQTIERINEYTFDGEAILTAGDGVGVGKVFHYSTGKIGVHQRVYLLTDFKCDGKYLFHYFSSKFYNRVKRMSAKNSVDSVRMEMIAEMPISLPSIKEQQIIGTLLSKLDERIATQRRLIEDLEKLKSSINETLYVSLDAEYKISFYEIGSDYGGLSGKSAEDFGVGKPFISYLNVYQNQVITDCNFDYVKIRDDENQNKVQKGDLLFTLSSETPEEIGYSAVYMGDANEIYLNSFCFGIHIPESKVVYPPYMGYLTSTSYFRRKIIPYAQGSTRFNLHKPSLMNMKFSLPAKENQKKIFIMLQLIVEKISTEKEILSNLTHQRNYLLTRLFI